MLCSEIWKQLVLTFTLNHGTYNWWYFSFSAVQHPYVYPARLSVGTPGERPPDAPRLPDEFCLLGGIAVFADTSGLLYPLTALTVHSWIWHFLLILIGISAGAAYFLRLRNDTKNILFSRTLSRALPLRPFFSRRHFIPCLLRAGGIV